MTPHKCPVCNSNGQYLGELCFPCGGTGIVWEKPEKQSTVRDSSTNQPTYKDKFCTHGFLIGTCWQCEGGVVTTTFPNNGSVVFAKPN